MSAEGRNFKAGQCCSTADLTLYGPCILESVVYDGFAFIKKGGFPHVKYGNNWHVKG